MANALVENINRTSNAQCPTPNAELSFDPFSYQRRATQKIERNGVKLGGDELIRVVLRQANLDKIAHKIDRMGDYKPEIVYEDANIVEIDPAMTRRLRNSTRAKCAVCHREGRHRSPGDRGIPFARGKVARPPSDSAEGFSSFRAKSRNPPQDLRVNQRAPSTPLRSAQDDSKQFLTTLLTASTNIGSLLCDGIGDAILVQGEEAPGQALRLSYNILQAAGSRIFKTDYVACPSCGRTLFNLQTTTAHIKAATLHLKGVKIAIMGCIVNGPGEMADADFGYVGGAPGKINLYVGKTAVKFNIPEAEAVDRLKDLIREHGKWVDPAPQPTPVEAVS